MKIASLFTGVGGAEIGLGRIFPDAEHLFFCEYDPHASAVLAHHWPIVPNYGDVTAVDWSKVAKPDLLHASPPCQAFSVAGKQLGMSDSRGLPMWEAYFKCLEALRPEIITLEEVPAVASKKFAKEWEWIQSEWVRLGYHVKWTLLQALDFGVPQSRNRLIVVGFQDEAKCLAFQWPEKQPRVKKLKDILEPESEVDPKYYLKTEAIVKLLSKMTEAQIQRLTELGTSTVRAKLPGNMEPFEISRPLMASDFKEPQTVIVHHPITINPFTAQEQDFARTLRKGGQHSLDDQHNCDTIGIVINRSVIVQQPATDGVQCLNYPAPQDARLTSPEGDSPVLGALGGGGSAKCPWIVVQGNDGKHRVQVGDCWISIRRLTPRECNRLQAFPDDWCLVPIGKKMMSNSAMYRQMGNAVCTAVIEAVARSLCPKS
jgi:DNA (cytosine-5)-methyltransferase 1